MFLNFRINQKPATDIHVFVLLPDTADSVSRELVEAGLIDGKDMIVGE